MEKIERFLLDSKDQGLVRRVREATIALHQYIGPPGAAQNSV